MIYLEIIAWCVGYILLTFGGYLGFAYLTLSSDDLKSGTKNAIARWVCANEDPTRDSIVIGFSMIPPVSIGVIIYITLLILFRIVKKLIIFFAQKIFKKAYYIDKVSREI